MKKARIDAPPADVLDEVTNQAVQCGAAAEVVEALAIVVRNELHALRNDMNQQGLKAVTMADWEVFYTVPVLLDLIIEQSEIVAKASSATQGLTLSHASAA